MLVAWVAALGWLVERHYLGGGPKDANPRWPVPPGSAYRAIRLGDRQVGIETLAIDTITAGLRVVELVTMDLPPATPGVLRRTSLRIEALYSRGLQLRRYQLYLLTEHGREERSGQVQGDTLLTLVSSPAGEPAETLTVPLRRPVVLPGAVPLVLASRGLPRIGDRLNVEVFDPLEMELRVERFTVGAESLFVVPDSAEFNQSLRRWAVVHTDTVRAWRLEGTTGGQPVSRWVDGAGRVVRSRNPLGAVLERSAFEVVQTNFRALPPPLWDTSASAPDYQVDSANPVARSRFAAAARLVRPEQAVPPGIPALEGGWQARVGDTIRVGPPSAEAVVDSAPDSRAEPLWSLDLPDSVLRSVAARASGRESRPEAIALALLRWVRRNIAYHSGAGTAQAGRVLEAGRGNAMERVLLLTALAKGAGLPARPVWGLVLIRGRWQLRTWAEVWIGHWLPLDPAVGPRGLDAGRIRLGTGGVGRLMDLALRAGRLRLEVLEEMR